MKRLIVNQGDSTSYWLPRWKTNKEEVLGFSPENDTYDEDGQMSYYLLKFMTGNSPGAHPEAVIIALIEFLETRMQLKTSDKPRTKKAINALEKALWELEESERNKDIYIKRPKGKIETITRDEES